MEAASTATGSVPRVFAVIRALSAVQTEGGRVTQLARAVGLTQGTTHRLLQSLVAEGMVEQDDAAADAASARIVIAGDQRTYAGVGAQYPGPSHDRRQLFPLAQQNIDLFGRHPDVVNILIVDMGGGGANQGNSIAGYEDVGICRFTTTVYHMLIDTVVEYQQGSFGREHANP